MQKIIFIILLLTIFMQSFAQDCPFAHQGATPFETSKFRTNITSDGSLFFNQLEVKYNEEWISISYNGGLWIGGVSPEGNLHLAAQTYGIYGGERDFYAGPINANTAAVQDNYCIIYDKVWMVTKEEIEAHLQDFEADGVVDNPIENIFAWPAFQKLFSHFYEYHGFNLPKFNTDFAPFFDKNGNQLYEPHLGEYPIPLTGNPELIPEVLAWQVMNDIGGLHTQTNGTPLGVEVQQLFWSLSCAENPVLENTIFVEHKIINRSQAPIDSMYVGLWMDFDVGCFADDYVGSAPDLNSYYAYNMDAIDGDAAGEDDCESVNYLNFGDHPSIQSLTFLNQDLHSVSGFFVHSWLDFFAEITHPSSVIEYYQYLAGRWRDGSPIYNGGSGFQQNDTIFEETKFIYSDDPRDTTGFSLQTLGLTSLRGTFSPVGSTYQPRLEADSSLTLRTAHIFHQDTSLFHLEKIDLMQENIQKVQALYDDSFQDIACTTPVSIFSIPPVNIELYPNPTSQDFHVELKKEQIEQICLYTLIGQKLRTQVVKAKQTTISVEDFKDGIYLLEVETRAGQRVWKKVIKASQD